MGSFPSPYAQLATFAGPAALARVVRSARYGNLITIGGVALMLVDYLHTLPAEVRLIWPTRPTIPKAIFFAIRYGNFVFGVVEYTYTLCYWVSPAECQRLFFVLAALEVILSSLGEGLMYVRVLAFSAMSKTVLWVLVAVYTMLVSVALVLLAKWIQSGQAIQVGIPVSACLLIKGRDIYVTLLHTVLLLSATFSIVMMLIIGFQRHHAAGDSIRDHRRGLLLEFYRAGIWYFVILLGMNITNILLNILGGYEVRYMLIKLQVHIHGIIVTRVVLHLRRYSEKGQSCQVLSGVGAALGDQAAMAGFRVGNRKARDLEPMVFAPPPATGGSSNAVDQT